nr:hypothetical protein [Tanacetum cinerariifolium]
MDSCWTYGNPFHSYENCSKEIASRKERVPETYDYQSQYDAYEHNTYHANYNIEMEDDTIQDEHFSFDEKYDKLVSMIETNKEANRRYEASFAAHDASFTALETHVDRLLEQLNKDETYEPQGITMLDFDNEDEEQNEEFSLHSTNTMEYLTFGSCKNKEDVDDHNNSFEDLISPIKEHDKESVPFKVGEEVIEANTIPYLPTLEEPILSPIDDIRSKEEEEFLALLLYKDQCSNLLDEPEVTHIKNPPQLPRVVINQVRVDDLIFENKKEQDIVSLLKDEHHVVERCYENSFSKLTHIIVKQVHRKVRVGVRNLSQFVCYGKKNFREVSNCDKLIKVASKRSCVKQVHSASSRRKRKRRILKITLWMTDWSKLEDPTMIISGGEGIKDDGVFNWMSSGVIGERELVDGDMEEVDDLCLEVMEDEEVPLVVGVFEGEIGALGDESWCLGDGVLVSS